MFFPFLLLLLFLVLVLFLLHDRGLLAGYKSGRVGSTDHRLGARGGLENNFTLCIVFPVRSFIQRSAAL